MSFRPLNDVLLVQVEPPERYSDIIDIPDTVAETQPIGKGTVLKVGPGRWKVREHGKSKRDFVPTALVPGDRIVFFSAATHKRKGPDLFYELQDDQAVIRESDVLFVVGEHVKVEV